MSISKRIGRRLLLAGGLSSIVMRVSVAEGGVRGVIVDSRGRPVPGAQVWTDFPRLGGRADAQGVFTLRLNFGDQLYIAAGGATASYKASKESAKLRLDPAPTPESSATRRDRGVRQLISAAQVNSEFRAGILLWLARIQPAEAGQLARDDNERAALLVAAADREGGSAEGLLTELDVLRDNFVRCEAAQRVALALLPRRGDLARQALERAHAIWDGRSVGGNALLFSYAALCLKLAPDRAERWIQEADSWAQMGPRPSTERIKLALELARTDPARAYVLAKALPGPFVPLALARLAELTAVSDPQAALAFLEEAQRITPADPAYGDAYEAAVLALLPALASSRRETALALAKKGFSEAMAAWVVRLDSAQQPATRPAVFRERLVRASWPQATMMAQILSAGLEPRYRNEILAALRQRLFADLATGPIETDTVVAFTRLILNVDPAAARAAIERTWHDLGFNAPQLARLAEAMAPIDASRAIQLTDMIENPTWSSRARGRIGYYLATGRLPD